MTTQPSEDELAPIEAELFGGRKIHAIKLYRDATGAGLAESKRAVEEMEDRLRAQSPEKFSSTRSKAGCAAVLVIAIGAGVVSLLARTHMIGR